MTNRRYKKVINRDQPSLLPPSVEDYVSAENPIRAVDAYVESLKLESFDFQHAAGDLTAGQPAYSPAALLKLYLYGYLNQVRSSRRLEKEAHRNLEVIWLIEGLRPTYKTIANFRKDNAKAIKQINKDFILLCKDLKLFGGELVAIDGSFFHANASKAGIYTQSKLKNVLAKIERDIEQYLGTLDQSDQDDQAHGMGSLSEAEGLSEKLEKLKARQAEAQAMLRGLEETGETQCSTIDPDARLLTKRGQTVAGYNTQISVDAQHKLITAHEVTHEGNDQRLLAPMVFKTKEALGVDTLVVVADAGYYNADQIKDCVDAEITPYVAIPNKSRAIGAQGRFPRDQFHFDANQNQYLCPAGQRLKQQGNPYQKRGRTLIRYAALTSTCTACELKGCCLPQKNRFRQITRWEHEDVIEAHKARMNDGGDWMKKRAGLAEHPFGTLKRWMGWDHLLVRGFNKVKGEMSLMVLCYNFKRVLNILGAEHFRAYCQKRHQANEIIAIM